MPGRVHLLQRMVRLQMGVVCRGSIDDASHTMDEGLPDALSQKCGAD